MDFRLTLCQPKRYVCNSFSANNLEDIYLLERFHNKSRQHYDDERYK